MKIICCLDHSIFNLDNDGVEPADSTTMFTDEYYARTGWNMINLPTASGSLLKYIHTPINGINVPWLYIGMLFASFCWHAEDNYLFSINYSHMGANKQVNYFISTQFYLYFLLWQWYGVPGSAAQDFEKV